jgi:hypothetical protein
MQSDDRIPLALACVADRIATFRGVVTTAQERVRSLLAQGGGIERAGLELGAFAAGRVDLDRFAALYNGIAIDAAGRSRLRRIAGVLDDIAKLDDIAFVVDLPAGGRLRHGVATALGLFGRAFGALAAVELIRAGRFEPVDHDRLLEAFPFELWSEADRRAAPPLLVRLAGNDLRANLLAEFMDGSVHIVLVPYNRCTPAPLARLVTPGTLVLQTADANGFDRFTAFDGPAIAAFVPATSATFIHDPAAGKSLWQRMRVLSRPATAPRGRLDTWSVSQQADELRLLDSLAERPAFSDGPIESLAPGAGDPVDRLASWLLTESGVK